MVVGTHRIHQNGGRSTSSGVVVRVRGCGTVASLGIAYKDSV
jgi:hypothetical protein